MTKTRLLYIVNPISGTNRKRDFAAIADAYTDKNRFDFQTVYTERAGHASELARQAAAEGIDIVAAVGGDGTVNEIAASLVQTPTALAIVPSGSGNGLARHLQLPMDMPRAIEVINKAEIHALDYGTLNGHPFFCTCGLGFDALISLKFAEAGRRGPMAYAENMIKEGFKYKPERYIIKYKSTDGEGDDILEQEAFVVACANASQYGNNAYIAPHASMKDGLLDIVVIEPFPPLEGAQVCLQLFNGTLEKNQHVKTFKTNALHITRPSEGAVHCDGDPFITSSEIDIRIVPQQLRVVVNPFAKKVRQCNLQQSIPEWFKELTTLPPTLQMKTDNLLQLNRNLLEKLRKN